MNNYLLCDMFVFFLKAEIDKKGYWMVPGNWHSERFLYSDWKTYCLFQQLSTQSSSSNGICSLVATRKLTLSSDFFKAPHVCIIYAA